MAIDPWSYAAKTRNEHAEQAALFMWANMAMRCGKIIANEPDAYTKPGFAQSLHGFDLTNERYWHLPKLKWLHAIHNQGHGDAIRGTNAKAEGVKAGVADVFLPVGMFTGDETATYMGNGHYCYHGLYIELKKKDSGSASELQLQFQRDMREAGYKAEIIHGWELAAAEILRYLHSA